MHRVFISGGTGYLGRALVDLLLAANHEVHLLVRPGSEKKVPAGATRIIGDALDWQTFASRVAPSDTFVHLTGVSHPAPWKKHAFRAIDLASLRASAHAAKFASVSHFVYVSVAQPAPVMKAYIQVRQECESILRETAIPATILRPWYVLGPGHRWPALMTPLYALLESMPSTRQGALRLGLVTHRQMTRTLLWAVEHPATQTRVLDVPAIREIGNR